MFNELVSLVSKGDVVRATKFISPKSIIRAVRRRFHGEIIGRDNIEIILTIGRPNYVEREFIRLCQKAGEPFPIKKIQLKLYTPKKKILKKK